MILAEAPNPRGGAWSSQGTIVFAPNAVSGLWKVAATGGPFTPLTTVDPESGRVHPPVASVSSRWSSIYLLGSRRKSEHRLDIPKFFG